MTDASFKLQKALCKSDESFKFTLNAHRELHAFTEGLKISVITLVAKYPPIVSFLFQQLFKKILARKIGCSGSIYLMKV